MRDRRRTGLLPAAVVTAAVAAGVFTTPPHAGAETALDKYQVLLQEKRSLLRENALLAREAEMAATRSPYIFFDLQHAKLEFRVRGKALKAYSFSALTLDPRGRRPADPELVWRKLDQPLTVLEVEGARPELIPPDPETGREAGLLYSDPNQLAGQTGATPSPVRTDAGVLGVDVPSDYYIKFEEQVVFHIRTPKTMSFREQAADRLGEIAENMRASLSGWWGGGELSRSGKSRQHLYLTADVETAKNLHYSLLPGEKIFVVPPSPPPIVLVASKGPVPAGRGAAAARQ